MQHFALSGQVRQASNKAAIKALRAEGLVPCNLYGLNVENVLFTISAKDLQAVTSTPASFIIDLTLDNGKTYTAVLHELQWHPISDECLHVDFLAVDEVKPIAINVPVAVTGHAVGVQKGGKFFQLLRKVKVCATMANLPDEVTIDITNIDIDKQFKAGEIVLENATVLTSKSAVICGVKATRNSKAAKA